MEISNKNSNNRSVGEKGEGDEVLELPIGILQDDAGQVWWLGSQEDSPNKNIITQQQHNNRAKERST